MKTQHTPLPWSLMLPDSIRGPQGEFVAECSCHATRLMTDNANAEFIARACNSHAELLASLIECKNALLEIGRMAQARKSCIRMLNGMMLDNFVGTVLSSTSKTEVAIAKATGGEA